MYWQKSVGPEENLKNIHRSAMRELYSVVYFVRGASTPFLSPSIALINYHL